MVEVRHIANGSLKVCMFQYCPHPLWAVDPPSNSHHQWSIATNGEKGSLREVILESIEMKFLPYLRSHISKWDHNTRHKKYRDEASMKGPGYVEHWKHIIRFLSLIGFIIRAEGWKEVEHVWCFFQCFHTVSLDLPVRLLNHCILLSHLSQASVYPNTYLILQIS